MYSYAIKLVRKDGKDWMENVVFRHEILKMGENTKIRLPHVRKVLQFSLKNELSLHNYVRYPCTKLGENW